MRISTLVAVIFAAASLIACIPVAGLPGSVVSQKSGFDGSQYVEAIPGWIESLDGSGTPPLLIGATVYSSGDTHLVAEVRAIVLVDRFELRIGERVYDLEKIGKTDIDVDSGEYITISRSQAHFLIDPVLLHEMANGQDKILVRVTTDEGYIEGDFGASCFSTWPDRACGGFREMLEKARETGLIQ